MSRRGMKPWETYTYEFEGAARIQPSSYPILIALPKQTG